MPLKEAQSYHRHEQLAALLPGPAHGLPAGTHVAHSAKPSALPSFLMTNGWRYLCLQKEIDAQHSQRYGDIRNWWGHSTLKITSCHSLLAMTPHPIGQSRSSLRKSKAEMSGGVYQNDSASIHEDGLNNSPLLVSYNIYEIAEKSPQQHFKGTIMSVPAKPKVKQQALELSYTHDHHSRSRWLPSS
jgi:hypothetical protein